MKRLPRIRTPLRRRLRDLSRGPLLFVIWAGSVYGSWVLLTKQSRPFDYPAIVRSIDYEVSPATDGRLTRLDVKLFEEVERGQLIASLDSSLLDARMATAEAEIGRLAAKITAARAELEDAAKEESADRLSRLRRFQLDAEQKGLDTLAIEVRIEADRLLAERIALRKRRLAALVPKGAASVDDLDDIALKLKRIEERIARNEKLLGQTRKVEKRALGRAGEFAGAPQPLSLVEQRIAPLREALRVAESRRDGIRARIRMLAIRSPIDGIVSRITATEGQAVREGEALVHLTPLESREALVYIKEGDPEAAELRPGRRLLCARPGAPRKILCGAKVVRIGPELVELPSRLWANPRVPEFGLPVLVGLDAGTDLRPGEVVRLRLD